MEINPKWLSANLRPGDFSEDQWQALCAIEKFMATPGEQVFILQGYAGTGKTYLIDVLCKGLEHAGLLSRLMAPTGRAAMVLRNRTGRVASTVHRLIYDFTRIVDPDDEKDDETQDEDELKTGGFVAHFAIKANEDLTPTLYILDEASMVANVMAHGEFFVFGSGFLLDDLIKHCSLAERPFLKLLLVGDPAQLPPVHMNFSPALSPEYLRARYGLGVISYTLRKVLRQAEGSGILDFATDIRSQLEQKKFARLAPPCQRPDVHCLKDPAHMEMEGAFYQARGDSDWPQAAIVTHSNKAALDYNQRIREMQSPGATHIQPGELIIITRNNYNYAEDLYNGQFAIVTAVDSETESRTVRFYNRKPNPGATPTTEVVTLRFRKVQIMIQLQTGEPFAIACCILDDLLDAPEGQANPLVQRALYIDFKNRYPHLHPRRNRQEFVEKLRKDPYFNALQAKYGYAITCHKAQGGEWPAVFVDGKVNMGQRSSAFYRWLYTALTRARQQLWLVDLKSYSPLTEWVVHPINTLTRMPPRQYPQAVAGAPAAAGAVPSDPDDPQVFRDFPFLKARWIQLSEAAAAHEVAIEVKHNQYVERLSFRRHGQIAMVDLNYNKSNFTGKITWLQHSDDDIRRTVEAILQAQGQPAAQTVQAEPQIPEFTHDFQRELYDYLSALLKAEGIPLTNISLQQYNDEYYLDTGAGGAYLKCYYTGAGAYSGIHPYSLKGAQDTKLLALCKLLSENPGALPEAAASTDEPD